MTTEPITHYVDRRSSLETTSCCGIESGGGWHADGTPRSPDYFTIYPEYVTCTAVVTDAAEACRASSGHGGDGPAQLNAE